MVHKGIPPAKLIGQVCHAVPHAGALFDKEIVAGIRVRFPRDLLGKCHEILHQFVQRHSSVQPWLQLILQQQCRQPAGGKPHIGGAVFLHQPELFHCPEVQFRAVQQQLYPIDAGELLYAEIPVHRRRQLAVGRVGFLVQRKGGNAVCKIRLSGSGN